MLGKIRHVLATLVVATACGSGGGQNTNTWDAEPLVPIDAAEATVDAEVALAPVCGDGRVQAGETCDPATSCPTTCTGTLCMAGTIMGSPDDCDVWCSFAPITACATGDGCCPSGCTEAVDAECTGIRLEGSYVFDYELRDLGPVPGVPTRLGGLVVKAGDPGTLLIGGAANTEDGALYEVGIERDADLHIVGFTGTSTRVAEAAYNDGGIIYGPGGLLFLARWPVNELGQMKPGATGTQKVISLWEYDVADSLASLVLLPSGFPGAGQLKGLSWEGGEWTTLLLKTDPTGGTYSIEEAVPGVTLPGGPEGVVTVPPDSPLFTVPSLLVSEYSSGTVVSYAVDASGDPLPGTRKEFVVGLEGAEGAAIDPSSGDFLFSTFGGGDRVIVVRGFKPILID